MKKILLSWLILIWVNTVFSQVVTITNQETGEPIESATLMSETPRVFATTNGNGQVEISSLAGAKEIVIRALGFQTEVKSHEELAATKAGMKMIPTSINLEGVVISATRWSQSTSEIPSRVASISPKDIALQNPQTAADLLAASGKVFVQKSQQGGGSPMIRGFATNRLLYTVDGVRMNTAIFRGGNVQNIISLDPFAIENAEVFFGAGSIIYGSDAIGGVMSFNTLTPQFSLSKKPLVKGNAVMRTSSANNEKTGHFDFNLGWKKWAMVTSFSSNSFGDLKMGSKGPDEYLRPFYVQRIDSMDVVTTNPDPRVQAPSGYTQINMMQKIRFQPNKKWDFQYGFHLSETSDYSRYDRHIRYQRGLPRYGEWKYGPQKWMMNNLSVTHTSNNVVYDQLSIRVAHQRFEESRISRDFNDDIRETRLEKVNALSANLDWVKKTSPRNKVFYGVEGIWNGVESFGTDQNIATGVTSAAGSRYPESTWESYGVYLNNQFDVNEKLLLLGGMRYNQFRLNSDFDTSFYSLPFTNAQLNNGALTGSVGMVYKPKNDWIISTNLATAFRAPNVDDIGKIFDSEPGAVVIPNPNLTAEYAYNIDLSITKVVSNWLKLDVTGFYTLLDNALVRRNSTLNGQDSIVYSNVLSRVQSMQNAATARVFGVQAGIEIKLKKGFGISSDFNFQNGEEELDDGTKSPSRHAAPWFGITRLTYNAHKLTWQLYTQYSGGKTFAQMPEEEKAKDFIYATDENGNPYSPGWATLNFKAMYHFTEHFYVSAGLENITDQRYRPFSSGIVAPGRNLILSIKAQF